MEDDFSGYSVIDGADTLPHGSSSPLVPINWNCAIISSCHNRATSTRYNYMVVATPDLVASRPHVEANEVPHDAGSYSPAPL
jgi:hypothetical protein